MYTNRALEITKKLLETLGITGQCELVEYQGIPFPIISIQTDTHITKMPITELLHSLQYIVRLLIAREFQIPEYEVSLLVDINGYWKRAISDIQNKVQVYTTRVLTFRTDVSCDPMNAFERKIVHTLVQDIPHITTESVGDGEYRHIVIKYVE